MRGTPRSLQNKAFSLAALSSVSPCHRRHFTDAAEQDVDFYVKRPTSIIHMEILHINDSEQEGSNSREILLGQVLMNLQPLESQKTVRQWYPCMVKGVVAAQIQVRSP